MLFDSIKFRGHRCFKTEWAGFDEIKPVNVVIGRNNTGKSHLLDLAEKICADKIITPGWSYQCHGILDEASLKMFFEDLRRTPQLGGSNDWVFHGKHFLNQHVTWETDGVNIIGNVLFDVGFGHESPFGVNSTKTRLELIRLAIKRSTHKLQGSTFRRLLADRDVQPEKPEQGLTLSQGGSGATNIIRRYLVTSNPEFPREIIQRTLLEALNKIFGSDGQFTEIQVKEHDEENLGSFKGHWEIFLGEKQKGLIPLSRSGSGLKTVILVLLNLIVVPEFQKISKSRFVFAFEELENNLHPALLRRLFQFLENYAVTEQATIFLTTHSNVALDLFGLSNNAQIIHVTHNGDSALAKTVTAHFDHLGVISELGAKPSDLLQANGIIWVEGPSDCIYLNRWIDLFSGSEFREGRDYQCAFYGGSLLARAQIVAPEEAEKDLVNLFRINPNIIVVCDGDRSAQGSRIKDRVRRIRTEVKKTPNAHIWVTKAREIENYLPGVVLAKVSKVRTLKDPGQYEPFFPRKGEPKASYAETRMKRKGLDKMDLAISCAPYLDKTMMAGRFDWEEEMQLIVDKIRSWNT